MTFQYHGTSVNPHAGNLAAATVNSGTASANVLAPPSAGIPAARSDRHRHHECHGCFATGNGTMIVTVYYSVITLG